MCTAYGPPDVLRLKDMPKPVPKDDDEVLVRIRATTVGAADCELRRFYFAPWIWVPVRLAFGIRRPRQPVLGQELAGDVESVGNEVRLLRKGDRVFAATGIGLGAYAEYICLRENPKTGGDHDDAREPELRGGCGRALWVVARPCSSCGRRTSRAGRGS